MLTKDNTLMVARWFFDEPERDFHLRELARLTDLSAPGVRKILWKLEKEGLIIIAKGKVAQSIRAARTPYFTFKKRLYNMDALWRSGVIDSLNDAYEEPEAIVLFGSYAKGEDASQSDIDIAVVTKKKIPFSATKFEKALHHRLHIIETDIKRAEPEFLNALANGIVLSGYLTVVK